MPPGPAWADKYGKRQIPFGVYSLVFGIVTEVYDDALCTYSPVADSLHPMHDWIAQRSEVLLHQGFRFYFQELKENLDHVLSLVSGHVCHHGQLRHIWVSTVRGSTHFF